MPKTSAVEQALTLAEGLQRDLKALRLEGLRDNLRTLIRTLRNARTTQQTAQARAERVLHERADQARAYAGTGVPVDTVRRELGLRRSTWALVLAELERRRVVVRDGRLEAAGGDATRMRAVHIADSAVGGVPRRRLQSQLGWSAATLHEACQHARQQGWVVLERDRRGCAIIRTITLPDGRTPSVTPGVTRDATNAASGHSTDEETP